MILWVVSNSISGYLSVVDPLVDVGGNLRGEHLPEGVHLSGRNHLFYWGDHLSVGTTEGVATLLGGEPGEVGDGTWITCLDSDSSFLGESRLRWGTPVRNHLAEIGPHF